MKDDGIRLNDELVQQYLDGELDGETASAVELELARDESWASVLADYRVVGRMLRSTAALADPDELAVRRTWEAVAGRIVGQADPSPARRKLWAWMAAAAALLIAAVSFYLYPGALVQSARAGDQLEVESIDCNYAGFMLLQPASEDGHTIIWINDAGDGDR